MDFVDVLDVLDVLWYGMGRRVWDGDKSGDCCCLCCLCMLMLWMLWMFNGMIWEVGYGREGMGGKGRGREGS